MVDVAQGGTIPPAAPLPGAPAPAADTVKVRVAYPLDIFEHGVEGVEKLTTKFLTIAKAKLPALELAAKAAAVKLITEEV